MALTNTGAGRKSSAQHLQNVFERLKDPSLYNGIGSYPYEMVELFYNVNSKQLSLRNELGTTIFVTTYHFKRYRQWTWEQLCESIARRIKRTAAESMGNLMKSWTDKWTIDGKPYTPTKPALSGYILPEDLDLDRARLEAEKLLGHENLMGIGIKKELIIDFIKCSLCVELLGLEDQVDAFLDKAQDLIRKGSNMSLSIDILKGLGRYELLADSLFELIGRETKALLVHKKSEWSVFDYSDGKVVNVLSEVRSDLVAQHIAPERLKVIVKRVTSPEFNAITLTERAREILGIFLRRLGAQDLYLIKSGSEVLSPKLSGLPFYIDPIKDDGQLLNNRPFEEWDDLSKVVICNDYLEFASQGEIESVKQRGGRFVPRVTELKKGFMTITT